MSEHVFTGNWITDGEFASLKARNVFHRQLEKVNLPCDEHLDCHILFRRRFTLESRPDKAEVFISADDYYKLYINGEFVSQGPAPAYPQKYGYNVVDVTRFLKKGENILAVHTLYQGLINRVWVSGDNRHGLICDLVADGEVVLKSDESFLTHRHGAYTPTGTFGYSTQFAERFDSSADEIDFYRPDFDDSAWENAKKREYTDYGLVLQPTSSLVFESVSPVSIQHSANTMIIDFGSCYVGYLKVKAKGKKGDKITVRCAQELCDDGSIRYKLRANCVYEEEWLLSGKEEPDVLDWFDYKAFRYVSLCVPDGAEIEDVKLIARHYPFELKAEMRPEYKNDRKLKAVWELCVRTQHYGVQEVIQDCMEREKGFYVGDGCYTALANMLLTKDDSIVRKLIDDAFTSTFITPGMVTCLDCSVMQEIAEYPLMLISLILWHYRLCGDREYLERNYNGVCRLLESYRKDYEKNGLLCELDKWCVVEWPWNFRDGYDVDIAEGKVCHEPHVAINAYYIEAVRCANKMADILGEKPYRDEKPLVTAFTQAFYDEKRHRFTDSVVSEHVSYIGNVLPFAFGLCPDGECFEGILDWINERGVTGVSFFGAFPMMYGVVRAKRPDILRRLLSDDGAWLRIIREDGKVTFEGWGRDTKSNTSLFHMTLSDAAVFLCDTDLYKLFE